MTVQLSGLKLGSKLGDGGQADVYLVVNRPGFACKLYKPATLKALNAVALKELVSQADLLRLEGKPITFWAAWPTELVIDGFNLVGFLMPLVSEEFIFHEGNLRGKQSNFAYLACSPAPFWGNVSLPSSSTRIRLLTQFAGILQQLHHRKMVIGDISWTNVLWAQIPAPRVMLIDCDGIRLPQGEPVSKQLDSPDWSDPKASSVKPPDADRDCYKLALMVLRVLARSLTARPEEFERYSLGDIAEETKVGLRSLFVRASGETGTRPSATEWMFVLQGRRIHTVRSPDKHVASLDSPAKSSASQRPWRPVGTSAEIPASPIEAPKNDGIAAGTAQRSWIPVLPLDD